MTPQDLIAAFDVLSDAPDGIKRLRELVLSLAVRGKLVEQDPEDEPAQLWLDRVKSELHELSARVGMKRAKVVNQSELASVPFRLPAGWSPCRLADLGVVTGGKTPRKSRSAYWTGGVPWVSPKDMKTLTIEGSQDEVSPKAVEDGLKLIPAGSLLVVVRRGVILTPAIM